MYTDLALYIGGEWRKDFAGGEEVINPATEKPVGFVPHIDPQRLDAAVAAASAAFPPWRNTSAYDRARILRRAADLMRERAERIARVLVIEQGKTIAEAHAEVAISADIIEWSAEEGRRTYGRIVPSRSSDVRNLVIRQPVGVVAAFTPWNFPLLTPARKIGGALAAGCTLILKASEETPGSTMEMVRCLADAGLPAGVLNLVFGVPEQVSEHLLASPAVRKVSFTGSIPVGKHLARRAADDMKNVTMELGGHAPVIVFEDADVEKAVDIIAPFKFRNAGQVCISPTRFYVHEKVYRRFVDRLAEFAKSIRLGDGMEATSTMGPLANGRRLDAMERFVRDAKDRGAMIAAGGSRQGNQGYFFEPTVIAEAPDDSLVMTEEPFGPLAPVTTFKTFDEVIERANSLPFGLASYVFTTSTRTATAVGDALEAGMVGINSTAISTPETPFGGVKHSGYGLEGGVEGVSSYLNTKFISQG